MLKVSLKYAAISGIFLVALYHVSFLLGSNPLIDVSHLIFDLIILGLFIFFAEKEFKSYKNGGFLHFWQGMSIGFFVYAISSAIFIIAQIIYFSLDADAVTNYQEAAVLFLNEKGDVFKEQFGEEGFKEELKEIANVTKWDLIFASSIKKMLAGFFITPVISIILRKQSK